MHRDIKGGNVMLDANYNVKVIDFGEAKRINEIKKLQNNAVIDGENFADEDDMERKDSLHTAIQVPKRYQI